MFFKQFPNTQYDLKENNQPIIIKNIFRHVDVNDVLAEDVINYTYYDVVEGERPDQVSQNLYGTTDYYWTFFIVNENLKNGLTDWPKDPTTLENEFALEFDPYGAIVCLPEIEPSLIFNDITRDDLGSIDTSPSVIPEPRIANTFSGYDLSLADLRVKRNNAIAKIIKWDNEKLQLVVGEFVSKRWLEGFHTMPNGKTMRGETHIPTDSESQQARALFFAGNPEDHEVSFAFFDSPMTYDRTQWIKGAAETITKSFVEQGIYNKHSGNDKARLPEATYKLYTEQGNLSPSYDASPYKVSERLFPYDASPKVGVNISVTPKKLYSTLREAPEYYYATDTDNVITAYEALSSSTFPAQNSPDVGNQFVGRGADVFITKSRHRMDLNFEKRKIKVVRPEFITEFVEEYKRLLNT